MEPFNGLGMHMGNLARLSNAQTRSISPENFTGAKGQGGMATEGTGAVCARDLGQGWKISPSVVVQPGQTFEMANIEGPGAIQQIWLTPTGNWRYSILRIYWDDQEIPSVECPVGDFFGMGWGEYAQLSSLAVCVNPGSAFNCYWEMPFRKRCRITLTNLADDGMLLYYQINYTLTEVPEDTGYFHAQFRRVNPLPVQGGLHHPGRRARPGAVRGHLHGVGGEQQRLVGRGRDQVLPGRRPAVPDHLRHRHRGLLLRLLQLRESGDPAVPGVHDALRGSAPGDPTRTVCTARRRGSDSTAGTSPIRSGCSRTSGSPSRPWAGVAIA